MANCPETSEPCDRMCQTMCHRRSEELATLRAKVAELEKDRERLRTLPHVDALIDAAMAQGERTNGD